MAAGPCPQAAPARAEMELPVRPVPGQLGWGTMLASAAPGSHRVADERWKMEVRGGEADPPKTEDDDEDWNDAETDADLVSAACGRAAGPPGRGGSAVVTWSAGGKLLVDAAAGPRSLPGL